MPVALKSPVRAASAVALALLLASILVFVADAGANNLDKGTMTDVARQVAKKDCKRTSGCEDWRVRGLHRVSRHKALGKIEIFSVKESTQFSCVRQIVIKLDHATGEVFYGVSKRRCEEIGIV